MPQVYDTCSAEVNGACPIILGAIYAPFEMDQQEDEKRELGRRLRSARDMCDLTQEQAAERLGITKAALSAWEVGRNLPDSLMLRRLATMYETTADALLYGGMPPNRELVEALRAAIRADFADRPLIKVERKDERDIPDTPGGHRHTEAQKRRRAAIPGSGSKRAAKKV